MLYLEICSSKSQVFPDDRLLTESAPMLRPVLSVSKKKKFFFSFQFLKSQSLSQELNLGKVPSGSQGGRIFKMVAVLFEYNANVSCYLPQKNELAYSKTEGEEVLRPSFNLIHLVYIVAE